MRIEERELTSLGIGIAGVVAVLAIAGAVVGALVAKNVIKVHNKAAVEGAVAEVPAATGGGSSTTTSSAAADETARPSVTGSRPPDSTITTVANPTPVSKCATAKDIPADAKGSWMDVTSWLDMKDFNCTFTDELVGGLPLAGLNTTWDDSKAANEDVPALNEPWGNYGKRPFRGVSLGGWLALEPFITPSIFEAQSDTTDEYTLSKKLGTKAAAVLEKHYSTFITEADFAAIAAAGLDHVRIPFSYWAVRGYDDDPYVIGVSWRYLLRGIEWARKYGLRVKLDLHGVPGSQNGWNHSGKSGKIDWISGPDGAKNAQRTLDLHSQLAAFFAQPRYKNIIAFYGLVNEPAMAIPQDDLISWTESAYKIVVDAGLAAPQVFSESMRGLAPWQGKLQGHGAQLALDVHQYTIFDPYLLSLTHKDRIAFACSTWADTLAAAVDPASGFGPTMVGEWSQADTDCTPYLNGMGSGARWTGTFYGTSGPSCAAGDASCTCDAANAPAADFSAAYKSFLAVWAQAQMSAFERSWGWFYWTWKTEAAPLWSYQAGLEGGFLPAHAGRRSWECGMEVPSFGSLPETY